MRYLIQHKKEFAITVAAFIMAIINLIRAIRSKDVTEELIVAVLVTGSTVLAWYYNMPTSAENSDATVMMRLAKASEDVEQTDEDEDVEEEIGDLDGPENH